MYFLTVSSRPCLETSPHSILRTPFAGHCLGALLGGKPCPAELSEGVNRVFRTLSGDSPLPILQTPSAGHCLDSHGFIWFGKRGLLEKGSFQKNPFSRDSREFRDSREPQTVENKGEADYFLEILENPEILEIPEIPPVKRPLS